jgi:DNA-binding NarL/FixJ family response regulator
MKTCHLLLIEAHPQVRAALLNSLAQTPSIQVVGQAGDLDEGVRLALELQPDIVLVEPKKMNALHLVRHLREVAPNSLILLYTSYHDQWEKDALIKAGASGYLLKTINPALLQQWCQSRGALSGRDLPAADICC